MGHPKKQTKEKGEEKATKKKQTLNLGFYHFDSYL